MTTEHFRSLVYKIMYLAQVTNPIIAWSTQQAAKHVEAIDETHVKWLKNLVSYIVNNKDILLTYNRVANPFFHAIGDSTWAECKTTRKSTGGYFVFYGACCIEWKSSKHDFNATSSNHAEYYEQNQAAHAAISYQNFFQQLDQSGGHYSKLVEVTPIFGDNKGAIAQALDPSNYKGTKHFELNLHDQRGMIANKKIALFYIPTGDNLADMLAKQPAKPKFLRDSKIVLGLAHLDFSQYMFDIHKKKLQSIDDLISIAQDFRREQALLSKKARAIRGNL